MGALSRWLPGLAVRVAERLFLRTRRRRRPERETAWLRTAERFDVTVEAGGGRHRLAAWSWGRGERVVLLVHGWDGRGSQLGAFVQPLVAAGFRVVTYDAPGHGDSAGRTSSLVEMADSILAMGRSFGTRLHAVVAHSAGAAATSVAMAKGLEAERLVYVAPPLDLGEFASHMGRLLGLTPEIVLGMQRRIERRFDVRWDDLRGLAIAPAMTAPLLIFHDTGDEMIAFEQGRVLAAAWRGSALVPTEGLGHWRILRDAEVARRAVALLTVPAPEAGTAVPWLPERWTRAGRRAAGTSSPAAGLYLAEAGAEA